MPEKAKEWAAKTDYSKIPEKVRKKRKHNECDDKKKNSKNDKALQLATEFERHVKASILPDGSGFFVGTFPLPKDHWLYSDVEDTLPLPYLNPEKKQQEAARYAIRGATNKGKITDFDPDALVQNFLVAMR
jgi:hypothetical protein